MVNKIKVTEVAELMALIDHDRNMLEGIDISNLYVSPTFFVSPFTLALKLPAFVNVFVIVSFASSFSAITTSISSSVNVVPASKSKLQ